MIYYFAIDAYL